MKVRAPAETMPQGPHDVGGAVLPAGARRGAPGAPQINK